MKRLSGAFRRPVCGDAANGAAVCDISDTHDGQGEAFLWEEADAAACLPVRAPDSNKGTNGRILVIAGSKNMCGAAYLCARAAYRCGAGLVEIFTCEDNRIPLQTLIPEAILTTYAPGERPQIADALARADGVVLGPGLGRGDSARILLGDVLSHARVPTVLDADALNLIAEHGLLPMLGERTDVPWILTPHPMEMARLTGISASDWEVDPIGNAASFAHRYGIVVNAKNARSVITDGRVSFINPTGNSALAKGGSGDVLSGICAVLAAQLYAQSPVRMLPDGTEISAALAAASLGAYIHGLAAEEVSLAMGQRAPLASEICDAVGTVLFRMERICARNHNEAGGCPA